MKKCGKLLSAALAFAISLLGIPGGASAATAAYVQSDTTTPFSLPQGQLYQMKFTVHGSRSTPKITAGNGKVLQTKRVTKVRDSSGNDVYSCQLKATGSDGSSTGVYTTLPGQNAKRQCVISVIKTYAPGIYKIGTDLPAGEYALIARIPDSAYYEVDQNTDGTTSSIITDDHFNNRTLVTVSAGQYLKVTGAATIYKMNEAPAVQRSGNQWPGGMYRVGTDLPAGQYRITPTQSYGGFYIVSTDSRHLLSSNLISESLGSQAYVTVQAGQYLEIINAAIELQS